MRQNPNPSLFWNPILYPLLPGKPISPTRLGVFKAATTHKPRWAQKGRHLQGVLTFWPSPQGRLTKSYKVRHRKERLCKSLAFTWEEEQFVVMRGWTSGHLTSPRRHHLSNTRHVQTAQVQGPCFQRRGSSKLGLELWKRDHQGRGHKKARTTKPLSGGCTQPNS